MRYIILHEEYPSELVESVNEYIKKGWTPVGGVAVAETPDTTEHDISSMSSTVSSLNTVCCQAMIRE